MMLTHANLLANIRAMGAAVEADPRRSLRELAAALPRHGADRGLPGDAVSRHRDRAHVAAAVHGAPGALALGDPPPPRHDLRRAELRLRPVRGAHRRRRARGPRPVELAARVQRRRARPARLARALRRALRALRFPARGDDARLRPRRVLGRAGVPAAAAAARAHRPRAARAARARAPRRGRGRRGHRRAALRVLRQRAARPRAAGRRRRRRARGRAPRGRVQFRGPSCTAGYYRNEAATRALFDADSWLESGDRGYLADGEIHVTGRIKDIIIRAGRNIHPQEIEAAVAEVPGIRRNNVAAFASPTRTAAASAWWCSPRRAKRIRAPRRAARGRAARGRGRARRRARRARAGAGADDPQDLERQDPAQRLPRDPRARRRPRARRGRPGHAPAARGTARCCGACRAWPGARALRRRGAGCWRS
ncbi:MAG: AMP-binding protein [Halofilum sp. (in: g-proteobacteria)]|nr:AMP-binding protein [Halofilum sp. (in: g-proteobacteria)]